MPRLSRRGFLALGGSGAAAVALGACGEAAEPREKGDDAGLLADAVAAETAYGDAAKAFGDQQGVAAEIAKASAARLDKLEPAADDAGAEATGTDPGATDLAGAASAAIAAYRQGARLLSSTELRTTATQFLAQAAGELAAVRDLEGEDPVPYAFVTGLDEAPLEYPDDPPGGETTTTSTTSTTTEGE